MYLYLILMHISFTRSKLFPCRHKPTAMPPSTKVFKLSAYSAALNERAQTPSSVKVPSSRLPWSPTQTSSLSLKVEYRSRRTCV